MTFNPFIEVMAEVNQRMSTRTMHKTWLTEWHQKNMEIEVYAELFNDAQHIIMQHIGIEHIASYKAWFATAIVERIFFIISTTSDDVISLATVASKLDTDCPAWSKDYEENMQFYSEAIYLLKDIGIFMYTLSVNDHPIIAPILAVKDPLRQLFDDKFSQALPQLGDVMGELDRSGGGLLPGITFYGNSKRRYTPLNQEDRKIISMISRQLYTADIDILDKMTYYVPTVTDSGNLISPQEQEDARTSYYRFLDMASEAHLLNVPFQLPTTEDSRGRFYNMATDPAVRLSLRSPWVEGCLTLFEIKLLKL